MVLVEFSSGVSTSILIAFLFDSLYLRFSVFQSNSPHLQGQSAAAERPHWGDVKEKGRGYKRREGILRVITPGGNSKQVTVGGCTRYENRLLYKIRGYKRREETTRVIVPGWDVEHPHELRSSFRCLGVLPWITVDDGPVQRQVHCLRGNLKQTHHKTTTLIRNEI